MPEPVTSTSGAVQTITTTNMYDKYITYNYSTIIIIKTNQLKYN